MTDTDARRLRGVAHPIRIRMLALLRRDGPATATTLARQLGLNTGSTSYHLRQLAEHGFIVDDPDRGVGRERWWRAAAPDTPPPDFAALAEGDGAGTDFLRALGQVWTDTMMRAIDATATLPDEWRAAQDLSDYQLRLRPETARRLARELHALVRAQPSEPDGDPVILQFQLVRDPEPVR
jgi:DNA-binding transcriptional ArsR family regulator